ncbi:type I restriction endonuclease subunit R [Haloactinomyces albus]|uniref:type I site-specific deoxyribonuclease n=1 Tax=Haloactinomyces albus TaxID=1352928 RepID=A0AAE3Z9V9_9ACTN|nr:type I restriction endonuclease subunit R [Haloactinomyces albus]MDR7300992.1 type I restriction enzyme R subunit [Haloactinomyces albus]
MSLGLPTEKDATEWPLIRQLEAMGWTHLPALTEEGAPVGRDSLRDVVLAGRLREALQRINTLDGQPWLDEHRISQAANVVYRPKATSLLEINRELTDLLVGGTEVDAPEGAANQRARHIDYIDWEHPERNDFVVTSQFTVELPGGQGRKRIKPDLVLFVNGLPLVVIETKAPHQPLTEALDQLRRYANQRNPHGEPEGSERLFRTNQLVVAANYDTAKVGTVTSGAEHFAAWKTVEPAEVADVLGEVGKPADGELSGQETLVGGMLRPAVLLDLVRHFTLFTETGGRTAKIVTRYQQYRAVRRAISRLENGRTRQQDGVQDRRGGIIWHTQGSGKSLTMVFLVRVMRSRARLRPFKIVVVTDRKQLQDQLRATAALTGETARTARTVTEVKQHLSYSGKDLVFAMIQKYRDTEQGSTDSGADSETNTAEDTEEAGEDGSEGASASSGEIKRTMPSLGELNRAENILVLIDEAHRSQSSELHTSLREALPNAALIGFTGTPIVMGRKKRTTKIFGDYIDRYTITESQDDGATVPIRYEGKTTTAAVRDADNLDELFDDMFVEYTDEQLQRIKQRWGTKNQVLEAPELIKRKARSMLWHYVESILPNGFKAQVVAVSRKAALRYRDAFLEARRELLDELDSLEPEQVIPEAIDRVDELPARQRRLVRAHRYRWLIEQLDFAPVISGSHNDPKHYDEWTNASKQDRRIAEFTRKLPRSADDDPTATSPLGFLIVKSMLLTGFDAPVEQVLYLDRHIKEAELLQAVARVNRTSAHKTAGYVVDYYGVAAHLKDALAAYADEDVEGALTSLADEVPEMATRAERLRQVFARHGIHQVTTDEDVEACVQLLADERLRAEFETAFTRFSSAVETIMPRPEAKPYLPMLKAHALVRYETRRRYREDTDGFDPGQVGEKVRELIDTHIAALGVQDKVPPVSITAADFDEKVDALTGDRAKASEMEHAIRHHISEHLDSDPAYYESLAERLQQVLQRFDGQWDQAYDALKPLVEEARRGRGDEDGSGLDPRTQAPFFDLLCALLRQQRGADLDDGTVEVLRSVTVDVVDKISAEIDVVGFWENPNAQHRLRQDVVELLDGYTVEGGELFEWERLDGVSDQVVDLAKSNHRRLTEQR